MFFKNLFLNVRHDQVTPGIEISHVTVSKPSQAIQACNQFLFIYLKFYLIRSFITLYLTILWIIACNFKGFSWGITQTSGNFGEMLFVFALSLLHQPLKHVTNEQKTKRWMNAESCLSYYKHLCYLWLSFRHCSTNLIEPVVAFLTGDTLYPC